MSEASGFQLRGSAPEAYQRYGVTAIGTVKAQDLVALAALQPGERVLDVACGTGVVARHAAHAVAPRDTSSGSMSTTACSRPRAPSHRR
jgi:cyclopropane fatty-acyl-phospholipid synthase-like methyltransferase